MVGVASRGSAGGGGADGAHMTALLALVPAQRFEPPGVDFGETGSVRRGGFGPVGGPAGPGVAPVA